VSAEEQEEEGGVSVRGGVSEEERKW